MTASDSRNSFARIYHASVAVLILLSGAALSCFGVWLSILENRTALTLDFSDNPFLQALLRANVAAMVLGVLLMAVATISLLALSKECLGKTFRAFYVVLAFFMFASLLSACVFSTIIVHKGHNDAVRAFVLDAWQKGIEDDPTVVCAIERELSCRGFDANDCKGCKNGNEPACKNASQFCARCVHSTTHPRDHVGCYNAMIERVHSMFLPIAITSGMLSAVVFVDILFSFCL